MKSQILIFESPQFGQLRTIQMPDGQTGFVGKDVAMALGYAKPQNAILAHVDNEDKTTASIQGTGSNYQTQAVIINESGLYSLILSSKLPKAREFKHWVTSEVLPQIRKTGGYIPSPLTPEGGMPSDADIMARAIMIAQKTIDLKNKQLEAQRPKVEFADAISASDDSILIRDLAKLLTQRGFVVGAKRLFKWLRTQGYLFKNDTRPFQKWVERGLFELKVTLVETHHGSIERITTKVTGRGQEYFINGFLDGTFSLCS